MLVVTNVEYQHVDGDESALGSRRITEVRGREYRMRFPRSVGAESFRTQQLVQRLIELGAVLRDVDDPMQGPGGGGREPLHYELSIHIGFLDKGDEDFFSTLWHVQDDAVVDLQEQLVAANREESGYKRQLADINKWYQELLNNVQLAHEASFWQRLKWLFTGVKI